MKKLNDSFGSIEIPDTALYGIHTARALLNFPFKGDRVSPELITAIAEIKRCALEVNHTLGFIESTTTEAALDACDEIIADKHKDQFPLAALQGGAGTSTNMNVNEVIARRASQITEADIDPIEVINLHQSTNDIYPTALRMVTIRKLRILAETVAGVQGSFQKKEQLWQKVVTIGRTEMQDAVPLTLGIQFGSFAQAFERDRWRCFKAEERVRVVNIGGTAVGTGLTAPREYIFAIIEKLRSYTGLPLSRAEHLVDATANQDALVEVHGTLLALATNLIKVSNDLRFLHYQKEIILPNLQAGSSIMPGKVNPVICEVVVSAALKVKANNALLADTVAMGTLQINEYMPLIGATLFESLELLSTSATLLATHIDATQAGEEACAQHQEHNQMLITAFLPHIGYKRAEELLNSFILLTHADNSSCPPTQPISFREFLVNELGEELVETTLRPAKLTALGYRRKA